MATLTEIAQYVGVSAMTVSRIMNDKAKGEVSSEIIQKVQEAVVLMGYTPRKGGRKCSTKKPNVSRLIVFVPEKDYFQHFQTSESMKAQVFECLKNSPLEPIIRPALNELKLPDWTQILDITSADRIFLIGTEGVPLIYELVKRGNRCAVLSDDYYWLDFYKPQLRKACRFTMQRGMGIILLGKTLYDAGCRNIAIVAFNQYMHEPGYRRIVGYERAMSLHNLSYRHVIPVGNDFDEICSSIGKAYKEKPFDGLIFSLLGNYKSQDSLHKALGIPESVKVVSSIEQSAFPQGAEPYASIEFPVAQMTVDAINYLFSEAFKADDKRYDPKIVFNNIGEVK